MLICRSLLGGLLVLGLCGTPTPLPETNQEVKVTILASRPAIRAGEQVEFTITATNQGAETVWTNPSIICTGSWDYLVRDANGDQLRVDDRDLMRCPSGGLLTQAIAPSASTSLTVGWDGSLRDRAGGGAGDAPRGTYEIQATVRWANREKTVNSPGPHTFTGSARTSIVVMSEVPPRATSGKTPPKPQQPPVAPPEWVESRENLRQLLAQFEPPATLAVTTAADQVTVNLQDYRDAKAALATTAGENAAQVRADFQQRNGVKLGEVADALNKLQRAHQAAVVSELARRHGISSPRMRSWGPAGSALGIHGYIDGEPVLLFNGKIYRGEERPHHSLNK